MTDVVVLDEHHIIDQIKQLPLQLQTAWYTAMKKDFKPPEGITQIVIAGMGGSGIAGHLAADLTRDKLPYPIIIWSDYEAPRFIGKSTIFIAVSYSGETEEIIDATKAALASNASIYIISGPGKLADLAVKEQLPIVGIGNDGIPPRCALGSIYGSLLAVLSQLISPNVENNLEAIESSAPSIIDCDNITQSVRELEKVIDSRDFTDKAEQIAVRLTNRLPLILTNWPLLSVAKRFVNQLNENSNTFACLAEVPEFCHNGINGLDFFVSEKLLIFYLESKFAFSRNSRRKVIIEEICQQKNISYLPLSVKSGSILAEQLLFIYFTDLVSYFLAGINGIDPYDIDSINQIKEKLK